MMFFVGMRLKTIQGSILPVGNVALAVSVAVAFASQSQVSAKVHGWLNWRGPLQSGVSLETGLPDRCVPDGEGFLWAYPISGGGTPVVAGERVYVFGYRGEGANLREVLLCLDAGSGELLWERRFNDFLSDIVYNRYAIGSPAVDDETGNVYLLTSAGILVGYTRDGELLWEHSLMEEFGRLTFPNGRTGAPAVDGDRVIVHGITANWGKDGPARDRFYAFDKHSGTLLWHSTPGVRPRDSSFAPITFGWAGERRVLYSGTGCGNLICIDSRTGDPLWRFQFSHGGVNSGIVFADDGVIVAIHGKENVDDTTIGRMVALRTPTAFAKAAAAPLVLGSDREIWRNRLESFTSSPVLHDGRVYQTVRTGELKCVDVKTGREIWELKLAPDQLHASPVWADGKLYVPMLDGKFYVIRPGNLGADILSEAQLDGSCIGAPAIYGGRVYVLSKSKLYCFGKKRRGPRVKRKRAEDSVPVPAVALQVRPAEFAVRTGQIPDLSIVRVDAVGRAVDLPESVADAEFSPPLTALSNPGVRVHKLTKDGLGGSVRGRTLAELPYAEDFESFKLGAANSFGEAFSFPPGPWPGARLRWQIIDFEGNRVLANTLDRVLFQRSTTFIGLPDMRGYTVQVDVMSDGNRRVMSTVGVVNQRYLIYLNGNAKALEVVSNHDRIKASVPFKWASGTWYRLKTRVDVADNGSGVIRAKAWHRDQAEPSDWTIEVSHAVAHRNGSPGLYAFSPQSMKRVFIDNLSVTPINGSE